MAEKKYEEPSVGGFIREKVGEMFASGAAARSAKAAKEREKKIAAATGEDSGELGKKWNEHFTQ